MPQKCTICTHSDRDDIDRDILDGGTSYRDIAKQYDVSPSAVYRHKRHHLLERLADARQSDQEQATDLLAEIRHLLATAKDILADNAGDQDMVALRAIREARDTLKLLAEVEGVVDAEGTVTVDIGELVAIIVNIVQEEVNDPAVAGRIGTRLREAGMDGQ